MKNKSIVDRIDLLNKKTEVKKDRIKWSDVGYAVFCGIGFYLITWVLFS